ncbi:MAG: tetratricopeptide repeat protein [Spirochaetales bacterium]|nr:tetratricopeptide repeat protein [Spirochaetales bacterium]MCF7937028.1 tetratricopeptide repeat protein [Spirochaetales bacterium]
MKRAWKYLLLLIIPLVLSISLNKGSYYAEAVPEKKEEIERLLELLHQQDTGSRPRFLLVKQIAGILHTAGARDEMNLLLTSYVEQYPQDKYNGFLLLMVAQDYIERGAYPFAEIYYERILNNHPDLIVKGKSVHYLCLNQLIKLTEDPEYKIFYYKQLISRFNDQIDPGITYYNLAKTYEKLGEWDQAFQAYKTFLKYPDTRIPGNADAYKQVKSMFDFHQSSKSWTVATLPDLINRVKWALRNRNIYQLRRLQAKVNFFAISWDQEETDSKESVVFDLGTFLRRGKVYYSDELDIGSNAREAYLKTWGWSYRIRTWYLYFRKIDFPADPEINGRWEWAGIYFGDKL